MSPISARRAGPARRARIVEGMLAPGVREYPMEYPVTTELAVEQRRTMRGCSAASTTNGPSAWRSFRATTDVVVLCEGDPFFYGSFMHLYTRLQGRAEVEVIAGIPGMAGCWNVAGLPIALGDDVMTVLMGTLAGSGARAARAECRCAGHHEDRPQSRKDPPRAGGRRPARRGLADRARHHAGRARRAARRCRCRRLPLFRDRAGARHGGRRREAAE